MPNLSLARTFPREEILPLVKRRADCPSRRDLKRIFSHRTQLSRSAESPRRTNDVRIRKFSARSANTRRIVGASRQQPQAALIENGVARKYASMKYRVATVGHFTHLPVLAGIASDKCPLKSVPRSATPERPVRATPLLSPAPTYPPAQVPLPLSPDHWRLFLLFADPRRQPRSSRNLDTVTRYPCCHGSRSDNRLESVANAHTAADLHVRPVSKTALVSRSWAPRAIKEIH